LRLFLPAELYWGVPTILKIGGGEHWIIGGGNLKLVKVDWEDTTGDSGWRCKEDAKKIAIWQCSTVGWLIAKTPKSITLCSSRANKGELLNDHNVIPKGCITKITQLREE